MSNEKIFGIIKKIDSILEKESHELYETGESPESVKILSRQLIGEIDKCDKLPSDFFYDPNDSPEVNYDHKWMLLYASPEVFIHILKRFPGEFERIAGYEYMAFPKILRQVIDHNENVSSIVKIRNRNGRVFIKPAILLASYRADVKILSYENEYEEFKECVRLLCSLGFQINDRENDGSTLLLDVLAMWYTTNEKLHEIVAFLIQMGALPDLTCNFNDGMTCLHYAFMKFNDIIDQETLEALLDTPHPIDFCVRDHYGTTPLEYAVIKRDITVKAIQTILDRARDQEKKHGYPENILDNKYHHEAPLLRIARADHNSKYDYKGYPDFEKIADLLIDRGASITDQVEKFRGVYTKSFNGKRLIDVVLENADGEYTERVLSYFRKKKAELLPDEV